ncbi:MAG: T9SS type A sorting domain-containing protein [Candidatus Marinimicrobia bacterium]|nr:T9SS type A sorting domain-containing protein [Candidatus Neomarinimicrobiota bacterium]
MAYESCANETVINGDVDLKDYDLVWWILGDESTVDETFDGTEQDSVESFLKQGGKFFVSGSEIGWDLDNESSSADKAFIHNYLKAAYAADDAGNYTVNGASGSIFEGLSLQYSEDGSEPGTFAEDYPDVFATTGGSSVALKYGNAKTAAVHFKGTVPGGSASCRVMTMGFPFETVSTAFSKDELAGFVLRFMGYEVELSSREVLPEDFVLYPNYPNPFNPRTAIAYRLRRPATAAIDIYDLQGRRVRRLGGEMQPAGRHEVIFDGTSLPSGVYVYRLNIGRQTVNTGKMALIK